MNFSKRRSMQERTLAEEIPQRDTSMFPIPEQHLLQDEKKTVLWEAVNALDEGHREIVVMRHVHNMSYQEMADALQCPLGTVMSRLYQARAELRKKLSHYVVGKASRHV